LKNNIEDSRNSIAIISFMAQHTLGRRIVEREKKVKIFGKEYELKAEVATINAFSSHADQKELIEYVADAHRSVTLLPSIICLLKIRKISHHIKQVYF